MESKLRHIGIRELSGCGVAAIETVSLDKEELKALISKTKVVLNTIGPYHIYSEPVVAACAETGAHYLDV